MKDENKELVDALLELEPKLNRQAVTQLGRVAGPTKLRELCTNLQWIDLLKRSPDQPKKHERNER